MGNKPFPEALPCSFVLGAFEGGVLVRLALLSIFVRVLFTFVLRRK